jgi:ATP-dependent DNA ligase
MKKFPPLYHKGKGGALFSWEVWADGDTVYTQHGQIDGKKQVSSKKVEPKNVGRANATTANEQAEREAASMFKFKRDRKYSDTPESAKEALTLPMLAHKHEDHKKKVTYPCHVQPKLDGFRCIARWDGDEVALFSRSGKSFVLPHISAELAKVLPPDMELDGELYLEGVTFQTLSSWIKKNRPESKNIEYHVYDVPSDHSGDDSHEWAQRHLNRVKFFSENKFNKIVFVETDEANSEDDIVEITARHVGNGMEGGIVRLMNGKYLYGYRSHELLKVKEFEDAEFKIVGYMSGSGKFAKCCIWVCETENGERFNVVPKGTLAYKEELYKEADNHIGEKLKVQFQGRSEDNKPRFPVGIGIRLAIDMSPV